MNGLNMSIRLRRTPYTNRVEKLGVSGFSIVNHMLLPKAFKSSVEEDYWHLREHVQIWDVSCQRQVETGSPDGTGASFNPKRYLKAGDDLEIHVSEIGTLRNYI